MLIKERWHHDEHCTIFVYFKGSGKPEDDHIITGIRYIDNTGKMGFTAKAIGQTLSDEKEAQSG